MSRRFAIYAAPAPDHPLWRFGSSLLGWDAAGVASVPFPPGRPADDATWFAWTAEPRVYGFHGTLKAPFRLLDGMGQAELEGLAASLAAGLAPVTIPRLEVARLGSFVALVPAEPCPPLVALAAACVEGFDPARAPLNAAEMEKRLNAPLTERQRALLERYGYPYVLDQFRFHMTLTGRLPPEEAEGVRARLAELHAPLEPALVVDALVLFVQDAPGERFRIAKRFPLRG